MTPIYATSTFAQESPGVHKGYEYSRSGNPTRAALESCAAALEGGSKGFAFASGLAAENCILESLGRDAHIIALDDLYGGTYRLFDKVKRVSAGLDVTYLDFRNPDELEHAVRPNTKMIWVETPSNPLLKITDLEAAASFAKEHKLISVCDNTFATPVIQRPLDLGFDIVVHSATKYINGHSDVVAGLVITRENNEFTDRIAFLQNATGGILGPFDSFLVLRGIKTLPVRVRAHSLNAQKVAEFLQTHPKIENVIYPGLPSHPDYQLAGRQMKLPGGMLSFYIKGGIEESRRFLSNLSIITLAESLGGVESLIEHPATMTHASIPLENRIKLGITDNLIRISVGLEDAHDLTADIDAALSGI
jgi:cystathionine beta-lyase/cystathionine gamma-synthase